MDFQTWKYLWNTVVRNEFQNGYIKIFSRKIPNFDSSSSIKIVEFTENVCFTGTTPIHKQSVFLLSRLEKGSKIWKYPEIFSWNVGEIFKIVLSLPIIDWFILKVRIFSGNFVIGQFVNWSWQFSRQKITKSPWFVKRESSKIKNFLFRKLQNFKSRNELWI